MRPRSTTRVVSGLMLAFAGAIACCKSNPSPLPAPSSSGAPSESSSMAFAGGSAQMTQTEAAAPAPSAIEARPLRAIDAPSDSVARWRDRLCAIPGVGCLHHPTERALYQAASESPDVAWGIVARGPVLLKLRLDDGGDTWTVDRRWDFSRYVHSAPHLSDSWVEERLTIYPALYPLGPTTWAVAIVKDVSQMFAGGGAAYSIADFVALTDVVRPTAAVYGGVPFSCNKDLRGCFGEEDERRLVNCRDKYEGFLTLSYAPSSSPDRYRWTAVWHETDQPPGVARPRRLAPEAVVMPLDGTPASRACAQMTFCGWPVGW